MHAPRKGRLFCQRQVRSDLGLRIRGLGASCDNGDGVAAHPVKRPGRYVSEVGADRPGPDAPETDFEPGLNRSARSQRDASRTSFFSNSSPLWTARSPQGARSRTKAPWHGTRWAGMQQVPPPGRTKRPRQTLFLVQSRLSPPPPRASRVSHGRSTIGHDQDGGPGR